jgi:hypothetical protein
MDSLSPRQANRDGTLPVVADEPRFLTTGRRRSPLSDLLQPRRPAPRHRGEFLVLPMPSSISISSRRAPASVVADHRRADTPPVMLQWPPGHSATTIGFTLVPWFFLSYSIVRGGSRASPTSSVGRRRWAPGTGQWFWPGQCHQGSWRGPGPSVREIG